MTPGGTTSRLRRLLRTVGPPRLAATLAVLLFAIACAALSWRSPLLSVESHLYDKRLGVTAPRVGQDRRIVMIVFTDDTLARTAKRSPLDRGVLARALRRLDGMGARGIAIDMLIDQRQPEDAALVAAFRSMRTPTWLGTTTSAENPDQMFGWQQAYLDGFQRAIATPAVHPTSVRITADADNVARLWPAPHRGQPPVIARALTGGDRAFARYHGAIRYAAPRAAGEPVFASLPIDLFSDPPLDAPAYWGQLRGQIAGRYVLIGGDIVEQDRWDTPMTQATGRQTIGLEVHAAMLAQLLDRRPFAPIPRRAPWVAAALIVLVGAVSGLLELRTWRLALVLGGELIVLVALPFALQAIDVDTHGLPAAGWVLGWAIGYAAAGIAARGIGSEQRRFAQSALGRYLPRDVAAQILRDPDRLRLSGEKREICALFSDLEGFTKLSHGLAPEMVATLLNRYLDMLSAIVLEHGGTIDKFVGDAVVAFWGAPIARDDDDDRAIAAAIAMHAAGERFRREAPAGVPPIGRTRVGLHRGEAIVGNFGGEGRIQYTALGDGMNTAARLESANKQLRTAVLVSGAVAGRSSRDIFRPLGRICVSGRATPLEVFEPVPSMPAATRLALAELGRRFDAGDGTALDELRAFGRAHPEDGALLCMVSRYEQAGPGGTYVLESK